MFEASHSRVPRWIAAPMDFVKANWDAAVNKQFRKMGIGVILRDSKGDVLATLSSQKEFIIDPVIVEATVALRAVSLVQELGFHKVILKGDAFQLVQVLNKSGANRSKYDHLINEAKGILQTFHSWRILHVHQHLNVAAHHLAKNALILREDHVLNEEIPTCITDIISLECCT